MSKITRSTLGVKVELSADSMGNVTVLPLQRSLVKAIKESGNDQSMLIDGAYLQTSQDIEYLADNLSRQADYELRHGYRVNAYIPEEYAHCLFNVAY